jgi:hypothetical protein
MASARTARQFALRHVVGRNAGRLVFNHTDALITSINTLGVSPAATATGNCTGTNTEVSKVSTLWKGGGPAP